MSAPHAIAELLAAALAAGVVVEVHGDRLHLRGKRSAEPLVRALAERKAEVLAALAEPAGQPEPVPTVDLEVEAALAEVLTLQERVRRWWWGAYIETRLEVDRDSVERLHRIRDWVIGHPDAFEPSRTEPIRD